MCFHSKTTVYNVDVCSYIKKNLKHYSSTEMICAVCLNWSLKVESMKTHEKN